MLCGQRAETGGQAVLRAKVGPEPGARIWTGKDGRVEQEGLWKGTVCKHWLLLLLPGPGAGSGKL